MKTYIVTYQKPHGPNANPLNHQGRVVVSAATREEAASIVSRLMPWYKAEAVIDVKFVEYGSGVVLS